MAIATFQEIMLPLLRLASDGRIRVLRSVRMQLAQHFGLSDAENGELLPSGRQARVTNRVAGAKFYLERTGLPASSGPGQFQVMERGREVLVHPPAATDVNYLERFFEFLEFRSRSQETFAAWTGPRMRPRPRRAWSLLTKTSGEALLRSFSSASSSRPPQRFRQLVVELLLTMGYRRAGARGLHSRLRGHCRCGPSSA